MRVVEGFVLVQRPRLYANRKLGTLHRLPRIVTEFLEWKGVFQVQERTSLPFDKGYLAAKVTLKFDWSVVNR